MSVMMWATGLGNGMYTYTTLPTAWTVMSPHQTCLLSLIVSQVDCMQYLSIHIRKRYATGETREDPHQRDSPIYYGIFDSIYPFPRV